MIEFRFTIYIIGFQVIRLLTYTEMSILNTPANTSDNSPIILFGSTFIAGQLTES